VAAPGLQLRPVWLVAAVALVLLAALASSALIMASNAQQRLKSLETELVRRQQDSGLQATEARSLSRQADQVARELSAKMALLEARVAETTLQRSQLEELIQNLSRSRDESVLVEVEAAIRVAMQQSAITGSAEPMVLTLRQADERLARYNQPRLERVRRAVVEDLERTRTAGVTDIALLTLRLDDAIRLVDELPLLAMPERAQAMARGQDQPGLPVAAAGRDAPTSDAAAQPASAAASGVVGSGDGTVGGSAAESRWDRLWPKLSMVPLQQFGQLLWQEVRGLVRVSRIDQPEAMLVAPEQAWFLRQNLKLRLLNARLALLSRQFDSAQSDLREAQAALERYFDSSSAKVVSTRESLRQVAEQARLVNVPRPEATLAAIATVTATAGR
jgi:uroporphyrin-3 C-methyltransferase